MFVESDLSPFLDGEQKKDRKNKSGLMGVSSTSCQMVC